MRRIIVVAVLLSAAVSNAAFGYTEEKGHRIGHRMGYKKGYKVLTDDGSSKKDAIVIKGDYTELAKNEDFEICKDYGIVGIEWNRRKSRMMWDKADGKVYDVVLIEFRSGEEREVYFDITFPYVNKFGSDSVK